MLGGDASHERVTALHRTRRGAVVARQAHNLEVSGSNPLAATQKPRISKPFRGVWKSGVSCFSTNSGQLGGNLVALLPPTNDPRHPGETRARWTSGDTFRAVFFGLLATVYVVL